jgi:hypothetical protein
VYCTINDMPHVHTPRLLIKRFFDTAIMLFFDSLKIKISLGTWPSYPQSCEISSASPVKTVRSYIKKVFRSRCCSPKGNAIKQDEMAGICKLHGGN